MNSALLSEDPYRFNGIVIATDPEGLPVTRGSGFVASNPKLFFSAAHVMRVEETAEKIVWSPPPLWIGGYSDANQPDFVAQSIVSRGYFRWGSYLTHVEETGENSRPAFNRDISLAWGLEPFIEGDPAEIDFKGALNLKKPNSSMITGFPAELDYTGESGGYFLHATEPDLTPFKSTGTNYLYATHISTGPGNSGGPVWSDDGSGTWKAGGILVSGRPSEAGVYGFSNGIKPLLKAAAPLVGEPRKSSKAVANVTTSTSRMVMKKAKKIPDGVHKWTKIPLKSIKFPELSQVAAVYLDLTITTNHRGDLIVMVVGPDGTSALVHDGQGAGEDDLVFEDLDITEYFRDDSKGASAVGNWQVLVQDRLTSDVCVVTKLELEVVAEEGEATETP